MSFALPEAMRSYVDQRVHSGQYGNTSEYLRELIRRDQAEQAKKRLRDLSEESLNSGVKDFPMQWLHFEVDDHLDVVRLVGDRQDIIAT